MSSLVYRKNVTDVTQTTTQVTSESEVTGRSLIPFLMSMCR
jgi:hypothetical protein